MSIHNEYQFTYTKQQHYPDCSKNVDENINISFKTNKLNNIKTKRDRYEGIILYFSEWDNE